MSEYLTKKEAISYVGVTERTLDRIIRRLRDKKDKALRTETKGGSRRTYYISKDYLDTKYFPYKKQENQQQADDQTTLDEQIKEAKQETTQTPNSEFSAQNETDLRKMVELLTEQLKVKDLQIERSQMIQITQSKQIETLQKQLNLLPEGNSTADETPTTGEIVQKPIREKSHTTKGNKKKSKTKDVSPKPENTPEPEPIEISPTLGQRVWKFLSS